MSITKIFIFLFNWSLATSWHLWRILTLRPAYNRLSDTGMTFFTFLAIYWAAGLVRWIGFEGWPVMKTCVELFLHMFILLLIFERSNRNSSLFSIALGASAAMDFLIILIHLTGVGVPVIPYCVYVEWGIVTVNAIWFFREPGEVQRNGYLRQKAKAQ